MKGTLWLTLSVSLFLICRAATATTYYVAPPPNGNDSNPGTQAEPFATIQHGIDMSASNDTIIVTPGTYQGARFFFKSGNPGMPITLQGQPGAIVNSPGPGNSNGDNLWVRNSSYVIVEGFEVHSAPRSGIGIQADPEPDESFGVIIRNNHCHDNGVWGIFTGYAKDIVIEGNETSFSQDEHGIYVSNSSDNPIIRFNIVHDNNASGIQINADPVLDGDGIITNAVVDSNIIYNNGIGGAAAINLASVRNSLIVNNLLYNNRATGIAGWDDGFCEDPDNCGGQYLFGTRDNKIYNNTIVMPNNGRWAISLQNGSVNNEIKNSILLNAHSFRGAISVDPESEPGLDSDYNAVKNTFSIDDGDTTMTLAAWQSLGHDLNSFVPAANLFIDAANGDYHLITGSEAINQGTSLQEVTDDLDEFPRPQGGLFDIGAYESVQACPGDTTDPQVSITNPDGSADVSGTIPFTANATDDCVVVLVEFFVNGSSVGSDTSEPYGMNWNTTSVPNGTHALTAVAHDSSGNTQTSATVNVNVNNTFIFFDDFEDMNANDWTSTKGIWNVVAGNLTGTHTRKADIISPDYGGCAICTVEAYIRINSPGGRVSLLAWRVDKKNLVEIGLYQDKGKVVLKQKSGGIKVAKQSSVQNLQTGVDYLVQVSFDGTSFAVSLDGVPLFTVPAGAFPNGIVGFRVKASTGAFREILVF